MPQWTCKTFDQLQRNELYALLAARQQVFIVEQNCPYQDLDGLDAACLHLWTADESGQVLALARLLPPGLKHHEASIGRVLTSAAGRGKQLGRALMEQAIHIVHSEWPDAAIRIDAQRYLESFYQSLGFLTVSPVFDLDGIPHVEMLRDQRDPPTGA